MPTGSTTVLVTVRGPQGARDLELPGDVPVRDLLPLVLAVCAPLGGAGTTPTGWALGRPGNAPLPAGQSLVESEIMDGAVLLFREEASWGRAHPAITPATPGVEPSPDEDGLGGIGIRWNKEGLLS